MKSRSFSSKELQCRCCGLNAVNEESLKLLQELRDLVGKPMIVNSAYRCQDHNRAVGGAFNSQHLMGTAFDISMSNFKMSLINIDKEDFIDMAREIGFTWIKDYGRFVHIDNR